MSKKKVLLAISVLVLLLAAGSIFYLNRALNRGVKELNDAQAARQTTGTVRRKECVLFDETNRSYVNDLGQVVSVSPGTQQCRVYYEIDNFDQVPKPKRDELEQSEKERIKKLGFRFRFVDQPNEPLYKNTEVGDKIAILYRYIGTDKEIFNVHIITR